MPQSPSSDNAAASTLGSPGKTTAKKSKFADPEAVLAVFAETLGPIADPPPADYLDLVLYCLLLQEMPLKCAAKTFQTIKSQFVDWNEVRISATSELQTVLKKAADPLALALAIRDFLFSLYNDCHHVGLEFLRGRSAADVKNFFKKSPKIPDAAVTLLLERNNEHAVVPLTPAMAEVVERLGWVAGPSTPHKKSKDLHPKLPRERILDFYSYLLEHSRGPCTLKRETLDCPICCVRDLCPYSKKTKPARSSPAKRPKP